jgi:hypothetical protein
LIRRHPIPERALHAPYADQGAYVDCYAADIDTVVTFEQFVEAFYTTWLFKLERWILAWTVKKPSSDEEAQEIAQARRRHFAAWSEEARSPDQLLMSDFLGATRSWFMVVLQEPGTRLYFGSVVTARRNLRTGRLELGPGYRLLLGFHKLYSRALLSAARSKLQRQLPLK